MHKLVYKMYMDKIEDMEKDKDEMQRLTEMLNNPESEFPEEETEVSFSYLQNVNEYSKYMYGNVRAIDTILESMYINVLIDVPLRYICTPLVYDDVRLMYMILCNVRNHMISRKWKKGRRRSWLKMKSKVQSQMSQWRANQVILVSRNVSFSF